MCYERYKGFTVCAHADPQSTPTEPKHCDEFAATGRCSEGKKYVLVAEETMPGLCGACWERTFKLEDAVGSLDDDDEDGSSSTWRLWRRIGWRHKEVAFVRDAMYLREMMYLDMFHHWKGPDHGREAIITHWTEVFREFTDWLGERLEKRDARGRLYFPPGEEKGVRIEKKKVLQHLVRWTLKNLSDGKFNNLDTLTFRAGLDKAFNNLIYQWDTHFHEEPGYECAKKEFTKYWRNWCEKTGHVYAQEEEEEEEEDGEI